MILKTFGTATNVVAIKDEKKNSKIHLVFYNPDTNKANDATACYLKWFQKDDTVDEINSMFDLKAILHDKSFCKTCLKIFNEMFNQHYEELDLKKVFTKNRLKHSY